ncbi:MAG: hypothetical protein K2U26_04925, partial [Cyclobacteriaceae bacterium]|nr:hypothetical protein [Cyclobacteriaceae bacterium]
MKRFILILAFAATSYVTFGQKKPVAEIEKMVVREEVEAPLMFLAADEMRGRDTGSHELDIAANYIASNFYAWGLKTLPGADRYFQSVALEKVSPATGGELKFKDDVIQFKEQFIAIEGQNIEWSGECVYVGYG